METDSSNRKRKLIFLLSLILVGGFLTTSLVSYYVSLSSLRNQITTTTLPLTSDNVYSEIQRDLIRPVFISSLMANDTFLRDWLLSGEQNDEQITRYLNEIMVKYDTFTSFLVSEKTHVYYQAKGVLKRVNPDEPRDRWYFRVRDMASDYEINVDPDLANKDALTIFINHKIFDYDGQYIGATGVGLTIYSVMQMIDRYRDKYERNIYFVDPEGRVVLHSDDGGNAVQNIREMPAFLSVSEDILAGEGHTFEGVQNGQRVHINSRFVPELNWYLLVAQTEAETATHIYETLIINLVLCALITSVVIVLTTLTINAYQRITQGQQDEIVVQHQELMVKNSDLETALAEVKQLTGLLPICASCKKIRDDQGYWQQIELYIRDHSDADFSHGICPECVQKLYPEFISRNDPKGDDET